jgi:uncharacterized membrane protein
MTLFEIVLMSAVFLCSMVGGLLFAFAIVVMPGLGRLGDGDFLRAFQVIDRVIQNNQPVFLLVWVGSSLTVVAAAAMGIRQLGGLDQLLLIVAALAYLLGVQLPTMAINVPLNNRLQKLDLGKLDDTARRRARTDFEPRWNRWNAFRAMAASLAVVLLIVVVVRL